MKSMRRLALYLLVPIVAAGEVTGRDTIEGTAKRTAKEIGDQLRVKFKEQGWIH